MSSVEVPAGDGGTTTCPADSSPLVLPTTRRWLLPGDSMSGGGKESREPGATPGGVGTGDIVPELMARETRTGEGAAGSPGARSPGATRALLVPPLMTSPTRRRKLETPRMLPLLPLREMAREAVQGNTKKMCLWMG